MNPSSFALYCVELNMLSTDVRTRLWLNFYLTFSSPFTVPLLPLLSILCSNSFTCQNVLPEKLPRQKRMRFNISQLRSKLNFRGDRFFFSCCSKSLERSASAGQAGLFPVHFKIHPKTHFILCRSTQSETLMLFYLLCLMFYRFLLYFAMF